MRIIEFHLPSRGKRDPKDWDDWGDDATIDMCVKSRDQSNQYQFGIYKGNLTIDVRDLRNNKVVTVVYTDAISMHQEWVLD